MIAPPSRDAISFRQALFLATGGGLTVAGLWLMFQILRPRGLSAMEWVQIALFAVLFSQIAFGFSIAFWGFVVRLTGGDRYQIMGMPPADDGGPISPGRTAIVMPIFNEDVGRVFRAVGNMLVSLRETGCGEEFDIFILSDSNRPERWIQEEAAWVDLCARLDAAGKIFYRKRRVALNGKSGNIADFCRRWGNRYRYVIPLDADSLMTGGTLVRLVRAMDANPRIGIIQTAPQLVRGASVLQRMLQFSTRMVGPIFAAGSSFWHLGGGSYWGHNAIIRLAPFMAHCVLPEVPAKEARSRHIMSHDTVEAALMRRAGYQVWLAYTELGTYEEGPPDLAESLKRDRRWCQGNLQHFWFLLAPGTPFTSRLHIFFGLMAYLAAPLLVAFIVLSAVDYYGKQKFALMAGLGNAPASLSAAHHSLLLLALTFALLFLPKILGWLCLLVSGTKCFGGAVRATFGALAETVLSILLAPLLLYFYSRFVVLTLLGLRVEWKAQNRSGSGVSLPDAARGFIEPTIFGLAGAALAWWFVPALLPWLSPILVGWCLSIPLAVLAGSESAGQWLRRHGIFLVPEEFEIPPVLRGLDGDESADTTVSGVAAMIVSPRALAIHLALLRRRRQRPARQIEYIDLLRAALFAGGPGALDRRGLSAVLWDAVALEHTHRAVWTTPDDGLHPSWRQALAAAGNGHRRRLMS